MLSRVADSIYWMSRYVERVENLARFIDVTLNFMLDSPAGASEQWAPLVKTTGDEASFRERYGDATQRNVIQFLTFDRDYPHSILSALTAARENARSIRETISSEMWEQLNQFYYFVHDAAKTGTVFNDPHDFFLSVRSASHLFQGITDHTMSHGEGWHFGRLGLFLERADKTSRILDVKSFVLRPHDDDEDAEAADDLQWAAVLRSVSAFEMYLKRHHQLDPTRVVEFLLFDREFPRAVRFCVSQAGASLHAISGTREGNPRNEAQNAMGALRAKLTDVEVDAIMSTGLHEFVDSLQTDINRIGDAIFTTFVAIAPSSSS